MLYNLIAFALLLSGAAIFVGQISIDIERLVVVNLGLTAVSLFGVVIAIFIGIGLVSKEIEKRTLYTVLSRPVRRWEFIVGKFFGLAGTLVVNTFFMAIGVFGALLYVAHKFSKPDALILVALYFIILEFLIICSLALLFSSFSSPLLSAVFAFSLFVIGSFADDLRGFAGLAHGVTRWFSHRRGLSGAQFLGAQCDQRGGASAADECATDPAQYALRLVLYGDGVERSSADLRAQEPEVMVGKLRSFRFMWGQLPLRQVQGRLSAAQPGVARLGVDLVASAEPPSSFARPDSRGRLSPHDPRGIL